MEKVKFTRDDLLRAANNAVSDVIAPNLKVLFCGINPGLYSGVTGHHFARPGNRFWKTLHAAGFTPRILEPAEELKLLTFGYGITNVAPRITARADELTTEEIVAGGAKLEEKVLQFEPQFLAVLGIGAYRTAFKRPKAPLGLQNEKLCATRIWVLPNPSGLNANYQLKDLARVYGELREAAE